jgi:membrane protein YdbS with pleckstrin-like domain
MYIGTGETIIYETRPSLVPYILGGLAYLIFGLLITGAAATALVPSGAYGALGFLIFLFVVLPIISILVGYLRWTRTSFAITDKRALTSTGIISRNLTDCAHSKVQNVSLRQGVFDRAFGYGHLIFATAGINSTRAADVVKAGGVYWMGVKDPVTTRRFVHEVTEYLARQQKIMEFQDMARVLQQTGASMTPGPPPPQAPSTFACPKCGATLNAGARFCSNCGTKFS